MFSRINAIVAVDMMTQTGCGNGFVCGVGRAVVDLSQMRERPRPHWPSSEVNRYGGPITHPNLVVLPEPMIQLYSDSPTFWVHEYNLQDNFEIRLLRECPISMHVHGINDYGMNILDPEYEDRSDVTSFLSELETIASLDCLSEVESSVPASIESDLPHRLVDVMWDVPDFQDGICDGTATVASERPPPCLNM